MRSVKFAPAINAPGAYGYTVEADNVLHQSTWGEVPPFHVFGTLCIRAYRNEIARAIYLHHIAEGEAI